MIAEQTSGLKPKIPASFIRRIEHHKGEIARQRDALRDIFDDLKR